MKVAVDGIDTDQQRDLNNDQRGLTNDQTPPPGVEKSNGIRDRETETERTDAPGRGGGGDTHKSDREAYGKGERPPKEAVGGGGASAAVRSSGGGEKGRGLKFYDLGSGSGKAVFAAVLAVDFR